MISPEVKPETEAPRPAPECISFVLTVARPSNSSSCLCCSVSIVSFRRHHRKAGIDKPGRGPWRASRAAVPRAWLLFVLDVPGARKTGLGRFVKSLSSQQGHVAGKVAPCGFHGKCEDLTYDNQSIHFGRPRYPVLLLGTCDQLVESPADTACRGVNLR